MALFSFSSTLNAASKKVQKGDITSARIILQEHLDAEKEFLEEISGLQVALETYKEKIKYMAFSLSAIKGIVRSESQKETMEKEMQRNIAEAQKALTTINALLSKLWKEKHKLS